MNLLLAYDGSRCAEAAIDDLNQAGLPSGGKAHVVSVAEVWLPPPDSIIDPADQTPAYIEEIVEAHRAKGERILAEATIRVRHAESRVKNVLPNWEVTSSATYGSPGWEILGVAKDFAADLIVVGSQGHSALGRFFLGSVSQKVLTEAECSVRVARGRIDVEPTGGVRIVLGFDGSKGSIAAAEAIADRSWPVGTAVRLVTAIEAVTPAEITRFVPPVIHAVADANVIEEKWVEQLADAAIKKLKSVGLEADVQIHADHPKRALIHEAERWSADCIFVGANAYGSRLERVLLGSTSAAVAARAHCSVEVVRAQTAQVGHSNGRLS